MQEKILVNEFEKILDFGCLICYIIRALRNAGVAQLVEQLICNQQVRGSSPFTSSINGRVPERPKGTDCKSVAIQLRWFESTLFHQQKPSTFLGIRFLFCKKNMLAGGFEPRNYQCDGLRQQANFERSSSPPSSTSRNRVPFWVFGFCFVRKICWVYLIMQL